MLVSKRARRSLALVAASAMLAVGCGSNSSADPGDPTGGTDPVAVTTSTGGNALGGSDQVPEGTEFTDELVTLAALTPIPSLDGTTSNHQETNAKIYAALTRYDIKGDVVPDLAESWEANDDATEWTFKLRPDLKFSDGTPLTVADVLFTYETSSANEKSTFQTYTQQIEKIEAGDDDTVVFTLVAGNSIWFKSVGFMPIVSEKAYTERGPEGYATDPLGAGPYQVVTFDVGEGTLELAANPHYWDAQPALRRVKVSVVSSEATRLSGMQAGDFAATMLGGPNLATAEAAGLTVVSGPAPMVVYLGYNVASPGLDNVKLRQAASLAIDRQALIDAIMAGAGTPASQMMPPSTFGHDPSKPALESNLDKAKQLVAESGYTGQEITFSYPSGESFVPQGSEIAQAVAGMLQEAGLNIKLDRRASDAFLNAWFGKEFPGIWMMSQNIPSLDGQAAFQYAFTVTNTFDDSAVRELYQQQLTTIDEQDRAAVLQDLEALNAQQEYITPLLYPNQNYVYDSTQVTWAFDPSGYMSPQWMKPPL